MQRDGVRTITKKDLTERIADKTGLSRTQVRQVLGEFLDELTAELAAGNRIEFRGFGVFDTKVKAARVAQNPRTLEPVEVPEHRSVRFKPGSEMRAVVDASAAKKGRGARAHAPSITEPKAGVTAQTDGVGERVGVRG